MLTMRQAARAFGLLEMILVFAVVIAAAAATFILATHASKVAQVHETVEFAEAIKSGIQPVVDMLYAGNPGAQDPAENANTKLAISMKVVPAASVRADGTIFSPVGGNIRIYGGKLNPTGVYSSGSCGKKAPMSTLPGGPPCSTTRLYMDGISNDDCVSFVLQMAGSFDEIRVGSLGYAKRAHQAASMSNIVAACQTSPGWFVVSG